MKIFIYIICLVIFGHAIADGSNHAAKNDIKRFISAAENCEHFAGEFDPDNSSQEKRATVKNVDKYCHIASRQRLNLKKKYRKDAGMLRVLDSYNAVNFYKK